MAQSVLQEYAAISTTFRHNHQIRISPIRLIDQDENQVGIVSTSDALRMAQEKGLDLVEVAPTARPPVCRIMDFGKWKYQQQKKEDKSRASSKGGRLKLLRIDTVKIGSHDLEIKINRARDFLKEGNKVQFMLQFRGREMAHQDLGRDLFTKIKAELWPVSKVERDAKMEGRRMTLVLQPEHKPAGAKPPQPQAGTVPGGRPGFGAGSGLNLPQRPGGPVGPGVAPRPGGPVGPGSGPGIAPRPTGPVGPGAPVGAPAARPAPVGAPAPVAAPAAAPRPAPAFAPRPTTAPAAPATPPAPASR